MIKFDDKFRAGKFDWMDWIYVGTFHILVTVLNVLRISIGVLILAVEIVAWPFRVFIGFIFDFVRCKLSAGHLYALSCIAMRGLFKSSLPEVVRTVTVAKGPICEPIALNAGGLGSVRWYNASDVAEASYIASAFRLRQRCGSGPECIWIRGKDVFVSHWTPLTITNFWWRGAKNTWELLDLLDLTTHEWRRIVFNFEDESFCRRHGNIFLMLSGEQEHTDVPHRRLPSRNYEDLGKISELSELEEWYNSPLGWNKYHWMRAEGNQIRIVRRDRRALSHIIAAISSLLLYLQFRDSAEGWIGISVPLYGLIIANYTLVTAYAAEILIGKVSEVVEAKNDRYGVIVTRAIDRGYVRGFHVPDGDWLQYKNGHKDLPTHVVTKTEVNVTCNSTVLETKIKTFGYTEDPGKELTWRDT